MKNQCNMDCEMKKIFEDPAKYNYYLSMATAVCAGCIHFKKQNNFMPREEVVEPTSTIDKIFNVIKEHCIRGSG